MTHTPDAAAIPPDIAKLIEAHESTVARIGTVLSKGSATRAALTRAYASHTEPGLRRTLEIMDRQIQAYVTPNSDYSHGVMDMSKAFSKAIRSELDKLADDPIPEEWKSAPPEAADRSAPELLEYMGDDAAKWASEFRKTATKLGYSDMDEGWLIGWFANAIECSHDLRQKRVALWAAERWRAEVANRPLKNIHRRSLDDTWRQVMRNYGADPEALCGPAHDELVEAAPSGNHPVGESDAYNRGYQAGRKVGLALATRPAPSVATVTDEMVDRAFGAQPNVFGRYISDEDRRIMRLSIEAALGQAAPGEDS